MKWFRISESGMGWAFWLALPALLFALAGDPLSDTLRYTRGAILAGEWWRLLSGHWLHLNLNHLLLNLAGLLLVALLFGRALTPLRWLLLALAIAVAISLALLLFTPGLERYVGLSGLLHGLLVAGAVASVKRMRGESLALLLAIALKLGWEQWQGGSATTAGLIGGTVVVEAHLYGALAGLLFSLPWAWRKRGGEVVGSNGNGN